MIYPTFTYNRLGTNLQVEYGMRIEEKDYEFFYEI